ncbi:SDR family NAD(P)-dependent oxidoreductase [Oceanicaulis sp. MMSF_3324]|uniref:SDR family NAD(P)-dependent oxidoreductase n=1 Tax=Oceanicaulis sp. MMSF_3324 TaxID=3046702 RepID=UPI00273DCF2D|nr:SDR family oxidoreductase [Oceanicaulis sp. MMSF_3324]
MAVSDRVAIITGGAKGIGAACARRFVEEGLRVVVADIDDDAGEALVETLNSGKERALYVSCDVSDKLAVANLMAETRSAFDRVDILVNNAARLAKGDVLDLSFDDFNAVMNVNLRGAFLVAKAASKQMVEQIEEEQARAEDCRKRYAIINMSSVNAVVSLPDQLAYTMSKGALNQMTKSMALALAPWGVRVNAIGPGSINTDILKAVADDREAMQRILSRTPLNRLGDPDEIAGVAWFLANKDASYITGECIYADGGRLALNYTMKPEDYED